LVIRSWQFCKKYFLEASRWINFDYSALFWIEPNFLEKAALYELPSLPHSHHSFALPSQKRPCHAGFLLWLQTKSFEFKYAEVGR